MLNSLIPSPWPTLCGFLEIGYAVAERDALAKIQHPFIIKLMSSLQTEDKLFLVMEFVPGGGAWSRPVAERGNRPTSFFESTIFKIIA